MVSVIIPTYKRPELLKQAIASVLEQTYEDWELIISDNETPGGETWEYLKKLAKTSPKIHVHQNVNGNDQTSNVNFLLSLARGEWIKPLFDDDSLRPNCIEVFLSAVKSHPNVVLAGCLGYRYVDDVLRKVDPRATRSPIEVVEQRYAHLAVYLQDLECGGTPTHMFIRRRAIDAGAVMIYHDKITGATDSLWFAEILRHGDRLHLAIPLINEVQGRHGTITMSLSEDVAEEDVIALRSHVLSYIPKDLDPPSLNVVAQMIYGIRGLYKICLNKSYVNGFKTLYRMRHPKAISLVMKWGLRHAFPGRFQATPRLRYDFPEYKE